MNKKVALILGIFGITILASIWAYLLIFGTPTSTSDVFTNLGFSGSEERPAPVVEEPLPDTSSPVVNIARPPLRQLTLRPVAGFFIPNEILTTYIWYVERGTGYIFNINLLTGEEQQVTTLTVPQTVLATFAPDGSSVALTNFEGGQRNTVVLTLIQTANGIDVVDNIPIPPNADNLSYQSSTTLLYTLQTPEGTSGYSYNLFTQSRVELFNVPLQQITTVWGNGLTSMYWYPKPTRYLTGSAYAINSNQPLRLTNALKGFMLLANNTSRVSTALIDGKSFSSRTVSIESAPIVFPYPLLPEKCSFYDAMSESMWCGASEASKQITFLEDWYQGTTQADDDLWSVNVATGEMILFSDMQTDSGRQIDIASIKSAPAGLAVFFTNKIDSTLWMYDTLTTLDLN